MTREEIISQIAKDAKSTKVAARTALDSFLGCVTRTLKKGGRVSLVGFGTFSVSKRGARMGRNPRTGEAIQIKARKVARFKAGKNLSDTVNK
jgi:DNA-binding protein HU-beta